MALKDRKEQDEELSPLTCPKHGRLKWKHVTTIKTCGICMEELGDANKAPTLIREVD